MALTDGENGNGMIMPVQPMGNYGGGYGGWGMPYAVPVYGGYGGGYNNGFGGDWSWIIILFLFAAMGGWGNGFGGGFGFNNGLGFDFPWLLNGQQGINANTNAGFNQAATASALGDLSNAVTTGFGNVQTSLCNGFAGTTAAVTNAQNAVAMQLCNNEINSLNRSFAEQTANTQGFNNVQSQLANCCCENRLATQALQAVVQQENCADREALSNGIRDIITNQTAGTQRILDQLCQDKIDAKNERIAALENQVNMQNLAASQTAQTAQLIADNNAQTRDLINRIAPYPQPSFIVGNPYYYNGYYGNGWNNGCGCGNNFGGFNGNF